MRFTYKPLAAAVAAAAIVLAAGCSSSDDSGGGEQTGGKANLTYWSWAPGMDKVVEGWNASHPDIQVTVNKQDGGDAAVVKLLTAIKAGSGAPDIMQAEYQKIPTLVSADAITDIAGPAGSLKAKFPESVWGRRPDRTQRAPLGVHDAGQVAVAMVGHEWTPRGPRSGDDVAQFSHG